MNASNGVRRQALLLAAVPLAFFVVLFVLTTVLVDGSSKAGALATRSANRLAQADALTNIIDLGNRRLQNYAKSYRPSDAAAWLAIPSQITEHSDALLALVSAPPALHQTALRYVRAVDGGVRILSAYYEASRRHDARAQRAIVAAPATREAAIELSASKAHFDDAEEAATLAALQAKRGWLAALEIWIAIVAALGCVASLIVARMFGFRIAGRLERLAANARQIGAGLSVSDIEGTDEIAELGRVYHDITAQLLETHHERERAIAELERERNVAATLQRALLPSRLPEITGLRFDAAYITPSDGPEIGGDWFDVFPLNDRYVGLSVGDVAGHGLRAATAMGSVRQTLRAAARIAHLPSLVLMHANRMVYLDDPGTIVTVFYGVFDREERTLTYAFAGHPPPVVIETDGSLSILPGDGMMLGVDPRAAFLDRRRHFDEGSAFVLYTDGIVEVRRDYLLGMETFQEAIAAEVNDPSLNMADGIQLRVFGGASPHDDSAILVVSVLGTSQQRAAGSIQSWRFDGRDPASAHRVRRAVMSYLEDGIATEAHFNVEVIVGEVMSNIARHTPGPAQIIAEQRADAIVLHIEDEGPPFEVDARSAPDLLAESGRGIALIKALSESIRVERIATGNRLSIVLRTMQRTVEQRGATRMAAVSA